jgi:hypothetical protein
MLMKISFSGLNIRQMNSSQYELFHNDSPITTSAGLKLTTSKWKLVEALKYELECEPVLNSKNISYYSLLSDEIDVISKESFEDFHVLFRGIILSDPVLHTTAGREVVYQLERWNSLMEYLDFVGMTYVSLPQFVSDNDSDLQEWIDERGVDFANKLNSLISILYKEFIALNKSQKTVAFTCYRNHGSMIYGILLALGRCDELEYTSALLAAHLILPEVFLDVKRKDYKKAFNDMQHVTLIMKNYVKYSMSPEKSHAEFIKENIPNWGLLAEKSKYSLDAVIIRVTEGKNIDYSPYVMSIGKTLEINLKEKVFDLYQDLVRVKFEQVEFEEILITSDKKIEKFAKYLNQTPHHIELGSMLFILELYGGSTASKSELLKGFYEMIKADLGLSVILDKNWIKKAQALRDSRNSAAHEGVFNLEEANNNLQLLLELIRVFS